MHVRRCEWKYTPVSYLGLFAGAAAHTWQSHPPRPFSFPLPGLAPVSVVQAIMQSGLSFIDTAEVRDRLLHTRMHVLSRCRMHVLSGCYKHGCSVQ